VPTTKEQFKAIEARLDAIEKHLGTGQVTSSKSFSVSAWFWEERNWSIPVALVLIGGVFGGAVYVAGLEIDKHIQSAVSAGVVPIQKDIQRIDGDTQQIKGMLSVLRAQVAVQKYSAVPPKDLKTHSEELKQLKTTVAQAPPSTPGFWPAAFQVIQLASQSSFADFDKIAAQHESVFDNVSSRPAGLMGVTTSQRVFLKNHVEGLIFKDSVIRFDPSVQLVNDLFINCVFLIPVQENPSKPLQEIGKTLLASDLSRVTLNASETNRSPS